VILLCVPIASECNCNISGKVVQHAIVWVTVKGLEEGLALAHRILVGLGISLMPQAAHAGLAMN